MSSTKIEVKAREKGGIVNEHIQRLDRQVRDSSERYMVDHRIRESHIDRTVSLRVSTPVAKIAGRMSDGSQQSTLSRSNSSTSNDSDTTPSQSQTQADSDGSQSDLNINKKATITPTATKKRESILTAIVKRISVRREPLVRASTEKPQAVIDGTLPENIIAQLKSRNSEKLKPMKLNPMNDPSTINTLTALIQPLALALQQYLRVNLLVVVVVQHCQEVINYATLHQLRVN